MALLRPNQVVFYHPCDNVREFTKGLDWTSHNTGWFINSVFGSGILPANGSNFALSHPSGAYGSPEGATSLTVAFWTPQGWQDESFAVGWANSPFNEPANGLKVTIDKEPVFKTYITPYSNSSDGSQYWTLSTGIIGSGLFVIRLEYSAGSVSGGYSFNGAAWTALAAKTLPAPAATGDRVYLVNQGGYAQGYTLDEVVLWKDAPIFTHEELANLYNLGLSHGKTMDHYSDYWNNTPSGTARLFVGGKDSASGQTAATSTGHAVESGLTPLLISGPIVQSGSADLVLLVPYGASGQASLFLAVPEPTSGTADLLVWNQGATAEAPLYLHNQQAAGGIGLCIHGVLAANRPMFLRTHESTVSGAVPLSVYGSSGVSVSIKTGAIPLFLANDWSPPSTGISRPLFLKALSGGTPNTTMARSLFLKGGGTLHATADLYLAAPPPPRSSQCHLFIRGAGDEAISNGYTPVSCRRTMFIRVRNGAIAQMPLSITGFAWPSGTCDLNIFGILGIGSSVCPASLAGYNRKEEALSLSVFGIMGTASGNAPLFLQVSSTGAAGGMTAAYVHGY